MPIGASGLKILWPIDPFAEEAALQRSAALAIQWLTKNRPQSTVQPCYMANDYSSVLPGKTVRHFLEKISIFGQDYLHEMLKIIDIPNVQPLKIISRPFSSADEAVDSLLSFAERIDFDLMVASTRTRRPSASELGIPGSFVTALMQHSSLPVFAVNPQWRHFLNYRRIVFPTDLSNESRQWFDYAVDIAKMFKMKITMFHKSNIPLSVSSHSLLHLVPTAREALSNRIKRDHWEAKKWTQHAKKQGVSTNVVINSKFDQSYFDAFLTTLEKSPGISLITPPLSVQVSSNAVHALIRKTYSPVWYVPTNLRVGTIVREAQKPSKKAA